MFSRRNWSRPLMILLAVSTAAATPHRGLAAEPAAGKPLRVISYNVQFLPGLASIVNKRKDPGYRARAIGAKLADYQIVGLNEVFDDKPRELLLDQLRQAWGERFHAVVIPKPNDKRFNGGLAIASPLPLVETHHIIYSHASDPKKYGVLADGFAAKGVLHARIARGEGAGGKDFVDVFITHMEARDDDIRELQYPELAKFIGQHAAADRPALVMGDFNTHGNPVDQRDPGSAYHRLLAKLHAARGTADFVDLWPALNVGEGGTSKQDSDDGGSRIDYIFLSNPKADRPRLKALAARVNRFLDPRVTALSDHSAVEAELEWAPADGQ